MGAPGIELPLAYRPQASILIVTNRGGPMIRECLQHIAELAPGVGFETIVVVNGAPAADAESLREETTGVEVLFSDVNLGLGAALNLARPHANAGYLVSLYDDARPEAGWLESLVDAAEAERGAGAVGSLVVNADGSVEAAGRELEADGGTEAAWKLDPPERASLEGRFAVDFAPASSLLIRAPAWDLVGGADERYVPREYTDVDLCLALRARGMRVLCEPASIVEYRRRPATHEYATFLAERNRREFVRKWSLLLERQDKGSGATFNLPESEIPIQEREHDPAIRAQKQIARGAKVAFALADHIDEQRTAALGELAAEREGHELERRQFKDLIRDTTDERDTLQHTVRKTTEELQSTQGTLRAANAELQLTKDKHKVTSAELDTAKQDLDQTKQDLDQTKAELGRTETELAETKAELDRAKTELVQVTQKLGSIEADSWWRLRDRIEPAIKAASAARRRMDRR